MNNLKEIAVDSMEEAFDGCYTCDRVWSAWSYNTMGIGDFGHFDSDNHQFEECFESLIRKLDDADLVSKEAFEKKVMAVVSPFELYYNDNIIDNFNPDGFDSDVFEIVNLDEMFKSFKEYKASLKINAENVRTTNSDKNKLIAGVKNNEESEKFKVMAFEFLDSLRAHKEIYLTKTDAVCDYLENPSYEKIDANILEHVKDRYNLGFVVEAEAIGQIKNKVESGDITISNAKLFGSCDDSYKNFITASVIEESIAIANKIFVQSQKDRLNHLVGSPIAAVIESQHNLNYTLVKEMARKEMQELVNPVSDVSKKEINMAILTGRSMGWENINSAYQQGLEQEVIDRLGIVDKALAWERLSILNDAMEDSQVGMVPLIKSELIKFKERFDEGLNEVIEN